MAAPRVLSSLSIRATRIKTRSHQRRLGLDKNRYLKVDTLNEG